MIVNNIDDIRKFIHLLNATIGANIIFPDNLILKFELDKEDVDKIIGEFYDKKEARIVMNVDREMWIKNFGGLKMNIDGIYVEISRKE